MVEMLEEISGVAAGTLQGPSKGRINKVIQEVEGYGTKTGVYFKKGSETHYALLEKWVDSVLKRNAENPLPEEEKTKLRSAYNATIFDTREERNAALMALYDKGIATRNETMEILRRKFDSYLASKFTAIHAYLRKYGAAETFRSKH